MGLASDVADMSRSEEASIHVTWKRGQVDVSGIGPLCSLMLGTFGHDVFEE
jgi:hypothetical protein